MTHAELMDILQSSGIGEVAYDHINGDPETPTYIVYAEDTPVTFWANNKPYFTRYFYWVEVYTDKKDLSVEASLETVFDENGVRWTKGASEWLEDSTQYRTTYRVEGD